VHPVPDLSAWWDGVKQGDRTGGFPARAWVTGPNTVCSWDDPWPVLDELGRLARIALRNVRSGRLNLLVAGFEPTTFGL
jgi:hypothetical protein